MFPISLIFPSIVSPSRISVSVFRGTNGNRHFTSWVMFCRFLWRTCWRTTEMSGWSISSGGLMKSGRAIIHLLSSEFLDCNPKGKANYDKMGMIGRLKKREKVIFDALNAGGITSCVASNNQDLWPGLRSVISVLQHWQRASSLIPDQWRSAITSGDRPECNGISLHSFSTVSWEERNCYQVYGNGGKRFEKMCTYVGFFRYLG